MILMLVAKSFQLLDLVWRVMEFLKKEGVVQLEGVFLLVMNSFFSPPVIYFSFASHGIPREIVLVPPLNRMNVTAVNKDLCCLVLTVFGGV